MPYPIPVHFVEIMLFVPCCHSERTSIEDYNIIDKIIKHLKLTFKAERPPPPQAQLSMAAEERLECI